MLLCVKSYRNLTFLPIVIGNTLIGIVQELRAKKILVVVSGADKADIVAKAFFGDVTPEVPASILQMHPDVTIVGDAEALAKIPR